MGGLLSVLANYGPQRVRFHSYHRPCGWSQRRYPLGYRPAAGSLFYFGMALRSDSVRKSDAILVCNQRHERGSSSTLPDRIGLLHCLVLVYRSALLRFSSWPSVGFRLCLALRGHTLWGRAVRRLG